MQAYRISEFTSSVPDKVAEGCEAIRALVAEAGAEMIDIVMFDGGKGMVIARYASQAAMDNALSKNQEAFGELVAAGVVDGGSVRTRSGDKAFSF